MFRSLSGISGLSSKPRHPIAKNIESVGMQ